MIPTAIAAIWLSGLLSLGIIGSAFYLLREWYQASWMNDRLLNRMVFDPDFGLNTPTALLVGGLPLLVWAVAGGLIVQLFLRLTSRSSSHERPNREREGRVQTVRRPDGTELHVEHYRPGSGPALILTHGWGTDSTEWYFVKRQLRDRYRIIVWDLPGVGKSTRPPNGDYSLEKFAGDLEAVARLADGEPVVLAGHTIGGMTTLTLCKLFPKSLGARIAGLVLVHITYTNPVRTITLARLNTALKRPVIMPLLHLTIWLSPFVWLMNVLSYVNGNSHVFGKLTGFGGTETWQEVDFSTRYNLYMSPAVLTKGMFGMLRYDASATLKTIRVPTLVVVGDRDPVCKPDAGEHISREVPNAELAPLAPAKHNGFMEHRKEFGTLVADFASNCFQNVPAIRETAAAAGTTSQS